MIVAGKLNHRIAAISVLSVLSVTAATVIVFLGLKPTSPFPQMTMPDGTTNRIEGLTFGKDHSFSTDPIGEKLRRWLPKPCRGLFGKRIVSANMQTPPDSLVIWMTRLDRTPGVVTPRAEVHYIIDHHGCTFHSNQSTRSRGAGEWLIGMAFPTFPRGDPTVEYVISDTVSSTPTRFNMANPFKVAPVRWSAEEVPITKTNGALVAELRAIKSFAWPQTPFDPEIELITAPDLELWQQAPVRFFDPVGNCLPAAPGAFCTSESVWKVEATFFRKPHAHFYPQEICRITNVAIPKVDGITRLQTTRSLQGKEVTIESLRGVLYADPRRPNALRSQGMPSDGFVLWISSQRRVGRGVPAEPVDSKLIVRARDDAGRTLVVRGSDGFSAGLSAAGREQHRFEIYPWPDSRFLNIELIVQKPVRFEFFVSSKDYGRKL